MAEAPHEPVLVAEVVRLMSGASVVLDLTVGAGGHAEALLRAGVGRVVGVDRDPDALALAAGRLGSTGFTPVAGRFSDVERVASEAGVEGVDGVLYDLGVSSMQLDRAERGFSYRRPGPLDMRMGDEGLTAADVVNGYPEEELARVIRELGEERFAGRIAAAIVRARERAPLASTEELAAIVAGAVPRRRGGGHPARRTFQAIRLEVNRELEELADSLPRSVSLLAPGGRVVVISYHSLEDRIVKRAFLADDRLEVLTRKPVVAGSRERARNPRARSAKLRAAERRAA
ncbi:MAG TPA: 16S rRNA (cytosine(1402)-N(4))-methyltransferase RsmH [Actinomycetota bacterium]|nr:16S rRNA (cytosine(1402)-N(4))-methyltransferase RsmH [Actinomycetota bacterium]